MTSVCKKIIFNIHCSTLTRHPHHKLHRGSLCCCRWWHLCPLVKGTPTFKGFDTTKMVNQSLSKNLLYCISKDVAKKLGFENPVTYMGKCFLANHCHIGCGRSYPAEITKGIQLENCLHHRKVCQTVSQSGTRPLQYIITITLTTNSTTKVGQQLNWTRTRTIKSQVYLGEKSETSFTGKIVILFAWLYMINIWPEWWFVYLKSKQNI